MNPCLILSRKQTCFWLLFLSLVAATLQVSVNLHNEYDPDFIVSLTCVDLLPGKCCTAPSRIFRANSAHVVTFQGLIAFDIAAIWRGSRSQAPQDISSPRDHGCTVEVFRTRLGPGTWTWEMWEEPLTADSLTPASGASYIEMPRSLPPDGKASAWLSAEGVLGLVWGEGSWFGSPIASKTFGHASGVTPKSRLRRDIRSELKGTVYAGPPSGLVYPTFIEVNGTRYTEEGVDGSVYKDAAGNVLNLAQLGDVIESHAK